MAENLGKRPSKGILKTSSSFDNQETPGCRASKETKWDEMNIIATLHPPDKDYGHMKIEEPKTPYNFEGVSEYQEEELDSAAVASKLVKGAQPKIFEELSEEDDEEEETPVERERRRAFKEKRKGHYREWDAVQLARKKLLEEAEEDDEDEKEYDNGDDEADTEKDAENYSAGADENSVKTHSDDKVPFNNSEKSS